MELTDPLIKWSHQYCGSHKPFNHLSSGRHLMITVYYTAVFLALLCISTVTRLILLYQLPHFGQVFSLCCFISSQREHFCLHRWSSDISCTKSLFPCFLDVVIENTEAEEDKETLKRIENYEKVHEYWMWNESKQPSQPKQTSDEHNATQTTFCILKWVRILQSLSTTFVPDPVYNKAKEEYVDKQDDRHRENKAKVKCWS